MSTLTLGIVVIIYMFILAWLGYIGYTALYMAKEKEGNFWYKFYQSRPMFWVEIAAISAIFLAVLFK